MKPPVSPLAQGPALHATIARPRWQLTLPGVPGACATWQRLDLAAHAGLAFGPRVIAGNFGKEWSPTDPRPGSPGSPAPRLHS